MRANQVDLHLLNLMVLKPDIRQQPHARIQGIHRLRPSHRNLDSVARPLHPVHRAHRNPHLLTPLSHCHHVFDR
jgi:hypothetical protein